MRAPLIDLAGRRFGMWTVLRQSTRRDRRGAIWVCRCDCGTERDVRAFSLRRGESLSCKRQTGHDPERHSNGLRIVFAK